MDGKAFEHDEPGDTQTHFRFPQASSDFAGRDKDTDVGSVIPSDPADDSTVGRHGRDYTPEHEFPTWGESWGDTAPATTDGGRSLFRRRGSGRTDQSPAPDGDQSPSAKFASRSSSESDELHTDHGRHDGGHRDEDPGVSGAPNYGWGGDGGRSPWPDGYGQSDFPRTDLSHGGVGQTETGQGDFARSDHERTDYVHTDYERAEYGQTDYGRTDYGQHRLRADRLRPCRLWAFGLWPRRPKPRGLCPRGLRPR